MRRDYDPAELGAAIHPLLNSVVVPRPVNAPATDPRRRRVPYAELQSRA